MKKFYILLLTFIIYNSSMMTTNAQTPNWQWAKRAGGTLFDASNSVVTDASGNIYCAGYFESSTIAFGTTTLTNTNADTSDVFVAKYDASGTVLWAKSAGGNKDDRANFVKQQVEPKIIVASFYKIPGLKRSSDDYKDLAKELGQKTEPEEKLVIRKKEATEQKGIRFVALKV